MKRASTSRSAFGPAGAVEVAAAEVAAAVAAVAAGQLERALEVPLLGDLVDQRLRFPS